MLTLFSPAKVNLFLRVYGKGPDGYHQLASLFQAIDLCDELSFRLSNRDELHCNDPELPVDSSNLILKAAELFRRKTGLNSYIHCQLDKRIPSQAGLGGGSGNAATTLWALNELTNRPATLDQLKAWSAEIGSDISFFFSSGRAYCTGRGELLHPVPCPEPRRLWVIKPPFGLSTAEVYAHYRPLPDLPDPKGHIGTGCHFNDLEAPAFHLRPELAELKASLESQGCASVLMSGSGTAFFCMSESPPELPEGYALYPANYIQRSDDGWYQPNSSKYLAETR